MNIDTKITPRLKMVADMVPQCALVADVGTDHGFLPIYLATRGICEKAIAADVNEGPLNAAQKNIAEARMKDRIETVLSDGLDKIERADCVTIAGMGGELIARILSNRKENMTQFVLQPQRSYDVLRCYLAENGFEIQKEAVAREGEKMYCAFYACFTGEKREISHREALIGKYEAFEKTDLYEEYVKYRKKQVEIALLSAQKSDRQMERIKELEELKRLYEEAENEVRKNN